MRKMKANPIFCVTAGAAALAGAAAVVAGVLLKTRPRYLKGAFE